MQVSKKARKEESMDGRKQESKEEWKKGKLEDKISKTESVIK